MDILSDRVEVRNNYPKTEKLHVHYNVYTA